MIPILKFDSDLNMNRVLVGAISLAMVFVMAFFIWWQKDIIINNDGEANAIVDASQRSLITGLPCDNIDRRPLAVMLSSDPVTRPLSGIGQADIVFEMPVTPSGVTRMMAVYQCQEPVEIGSVRSAREDFIPLAAGLGTIYAHWGGEHEALQKLDSHIIDNVDAMIYETKYFYRKNGVKQPHNGFTNFDKLLTGARDLKYSLNNSTEGYIHTDKKPAKNISNLADSVSINYPSPFNVTWIYDQEGNVYKRLRGDEPEMDRNTNEQVYVGVVAVMKTSSRYISKDYITIITTGEGDLEIYQNGIKTLGRWKKDADQLGSKLFFYDTDGKEIKLAPGKIWVEVVIN